MSTQKLKNEKVFRDPVHDVIRVQDQVILDLIDTSEFQRLRRIKQLGITSEVYHGAEHSRFAHSLGVYEIARRFAEHLENYYATKVPGDGLWDPSERLVLLAAALLHDLGHGPYSHTFEHIFGTDHEAYTQAIILSEDTEIHQVLLQVAPDFPAKVAAVIAKTYDNQQVVQLISSQIDVDRMDYLLRDAYYSGATYGRFDLSRLMQMMRPYQDGIAFDVRSMNAVEDYIISRYQMYVQVYFHPVSRAMEVMLTALLARVKHLYALSQKDTMRSSAFIPEALKPLFAGGIDVNYYLTLDDAVLLAAINTWRYADDSILADLANRFLDRRQFKSIVITAGMEDLLPKLRELIAMAGFSPEYYTAENDSYDLSYDIYRPRSKKPQTQIELVRPDCSLVELSAESSLVEAMSGRYYGDARFFFPREMLAEQAIDDVMAPVYGDFQRYVHNMELVRPTED
ncbi:HD family metal-dependent phosphohydrolase [Weissella oryzae SG25]|uniref:HD family metal-dependent phosphohydrolase n=1 Tax=Weissella oryzae (strain DSM 25784 / JCM 18191 / LMG 30913 / SG25) TaxID=1329250 RepID=A0A069CUM2_WEIOS|nr:HD domain-containing protein [Weissella oryzae]GAK30923.1 HD family metal-dependent phosphohydrolase [Weissella oryzae SG25]